MTCLFVIAWVWMVGAWLFWFMLDEIIGEDRKPIRTAFGIALWPIVLPTLVLISIVRGALRI